MIARAARAAPSAARPSRSAPSAATMRSAGSGSPITPVEATKTCPAGTPSAAAVAADRRLHRRAAGAAGEGVGVAGVDQDREAAVRRPPPACSAASRSWHQSTGAERVAERVKTPAIAAPGAISASITSSRPG